MKHKPDRITQECKEHTKDTLDLQGDKYQEEQAILQELLEEESRISKSLVERRLTSRREEAG